MKDYDHNSIEPKWQRIWAEKKIYLTKEDSKKKKFYILDMFPYPSGEGLHVGHPKGYIATDIISRMKRMQGFSVLHPMGFDAFGLPAENYALKTKTNPAVGVAKNVEHYKQQLEIFGFDYDWSREINTTDPKYYKWTQWIFLKLLEKGLAYESNEPINWCPSCKTGLANEDVEEGLCERCGTVVQKKPMRQWVLKITDYADRLLKDLDANDKNGKPVLDWPESIKVLQKNWIGRSEGAQIRFRILDSRFKKEVGEIEVFTTRIDTIFSGTFVVIAPESSVTTKFVELVENRVEVEKYISDSKKKTDIERTDFRNKSGVELRGIKAVNPATGEFIPVWIADFVLADYGTGAVFADAHDERDFEMAKNYNIPLKISLIPNNDLDLVEKIKNLEICYPNEGVLINSDQFDGLTSAEARPKITDWLAKKHLAKSVVKYKLRDWVFSRQRYWGEPIPLIHCEKCGVIPVPEKDLPVELPEVKSYEPTGTGESPLASIEEWVNVKCPKCGGAGKRETNTMPQWAGSSWYYLAYMMHSKLLPESNVKGQWSKVLEKYWAPVDFYVGGAEHATRHLIYARFWHKFLYDAGVVSTIEPFVKLQHVGLIMGEDGRKMSKRWGNVVNPDEIIDQLGADTFRIYEMFLGPFDQQISWDTESIAGARRFVEKIWRLREKVDDKTTISAKLVIKFNQTIKKVSSDISEMKFNTAISSMMILLNEIEAIGVISTEYFKIFLKLLAPFAPHITEELWVSLKLEGSIHLESWPIFDSGKVKDEEASIAVQVNGKTRGVIVIEAESSQINVEAEARKLDTVSKWLAGKKLLKVIYVKNRLLNFVVSDIV